MEIFDKSIRANPISIQADETSAEQNTPESPESSAGIGDTPDAIQNESYLVNDSFVKIATEFHLSPESFVSISDSGASDVPQPVDTPPALPTDPQSLLSALEDYVTKYDVTPLAQTLFSSFSGEIYNLFSQAPPESQISALKSLEQTGTPPDTAFDKLVKLVYQNGQSPERTGDFLSLLAKDAATNPDAAALFAHAYNDIKAMTANPSPALFDHLVSNLDPQTLSALPSDILQQLQADNLNAGGSLTNYEKIGEALLLQQGFSPEQAHAQVYQGVVNQLNSKSLTPELIAQTANQGIPWSADQLDGMSPEQLADFVKTLAASAGGAASLGDTLAYLTELATGQTQNPDLQASSDQLTKIISDITNTLKGLSLKGNDNVNTALSRMIMDLDVKYGDQQAADILSRLPSSTVADMDLLLSKGGAGIDPKASTIMTQAFNEASP